MTSRLQSGSSAKIAIPATPCSPFGFRERYGTDGILWPRQDRTLKAWPKSSNHCVKYYCGWSRVEDRGGCDVDGDGAPFGAGDDGSPLLQAFSQGVVGSLTYNITKVSKSTTINIAAEQESRFKRKVQANTSDDIGTDDLVTTFMRHDSTLKKLTVNATAFSSRYEGKSLVRRQQLNLAHNPNTPPRPES